MKRTFASLVTLLLASVLGGVLPTVVAPPARAVSHCGTTGGVHPNAAIPDNGSATSTYNMTLGDRTDPLVDIDVRINITHSYVDDLVITLSYRGHTVLLSSHNGGDGDDYSGTWFDDLSTFRISAGTAPFVGYYLPEQSLNAFDGLHPNGAWTLRVTDSAGGDVGTLVSWTLKFTTEWCSDADRDTVKDEYDFCPRDEGPHPYGCPVRGRTVSLSYNAAAREFRGVLRCPTAPRCADSQPVRIYKVAAGKDPLISRTYTNETGSYVVPKLNVSGTYYAVAPKVVEENAGECKRVQSATITRRTAARSAAGR